MLLSIAGWSQIGNYQTVYPIDSCFFESNCAMVSIPTDSNNIWQIGQPNKIIFDSAFSLNSGIVTDTVNYYPSNNHSLFQVNVPTSFSYAILLSFMHRIDSDSGRDGGYLEISTDYGATWVNIVYDSINTQGNFPFISTDTPRENFYSSSDTLFNGQPGFSGTSNGWIKSQCMWIWAYPIRPANQDTVLSGVSDSVFFRFHFISDSIDNGKEGWLIDDIKIHWVFLGYSINNIKDLIKVSVAPNPAKNEVIINFKNTDRSKHTVYVRDLQGRSVINFYDIKGNKLSIPRGSIPSGMYFVTVENEKGEKGTARFVFD